MDRCHRCQVILEDGTLRFVARLRLCGELGALPDPEQAAGDGMSELQRALEDASAQPEEQLLEDVVEEFTFVLCKACRARLRQDPAGAATVRVKPGVPQ